MRLNRYLSSCGLGSRRGCEQLVRDGRVILNGKICTNLSTTVTDSDDVVVDGNKVRPHKGVVIVLHKPRGLVCSRRDERDRDTIYSLLPEKFHTLHHVGRLDKESEGLLLMTNRGEVSQRLLHPSQGVEKEYEVILETRFDPENLTRLTKGFHTEDGYAKAERAWMIGDYKIGMVLKQGLKRQIRMMLYFLGYEVKRLVRVRIGNLAIKGILEGNWKELSDKDVDKMLLNPLAKDRPKMSKPKTASVRKSLEIHRQKEAKRSSRKTGARKRTGGTSRPLGRVRVAASVVIVAKVLAKALRVALVVGVSVVVNVMEVPKVPGVPKVKAAQEVAAVPGAVVTVTAAAVAAKAVARPDRASSFAPA